MLQELSFRNFGVRILLGFGKLPQIRAAFVREPVFAAVAHLRFRRKHGAKGLAHRREIIPADPVPQLDELRQKRRKGIHHLGDFLDGSFRARDFRHAIHHCKPHSHRGAIAKGHHDAASDQLFAIDRGGYGVSKRRAQRNRQRDFAVSLGHCFQRRRNSVSVPSGHSHLRWCGNPSEADEDDAGKNQDDAEPLAALQPFAQKDPREQYRDRAIE